MPRNPDNEDGNVDTRDDYGRSPLDLLDQATVLGYDSNTVDDDLHQELHLEDVEK